MVHNGGTGGVVCVCSGVRPVSLHTMMGACAVQETKRGEGQDNTAYATQCGTHTHLGFQHALQHINAHAVFVHADGPHWSWHNNTTHEGTFTASTGRLVITHTDCKKSKVVRCTHSTLALQTMILEYMLGKKVRGLLHHHDVTRRGEGSTQQIQAARGAGAEEELQRNRTNPQRSHRPQAPHRQVPHTRKEDNQELVRSWCETGELVHGGCPPQAQLL